MSINPETLKFILGKYSHASRLESLHMRGRLGLCPYGKLLKYFPSTGSVLDIGCGFGHFGWFLAKEKPDLKYFGADIDEKKVMLASKSAGNLTSPTFKHGDILAMTEASGPYHTIVLLDVAYLMPWEFQKKIIAWALERLTPDQESSLLLKTNDVPAGWSGRRMLWEEWIMVHLLRRTKSSGTIQGVQTFATYIEFAKTLGFKCDVESMETYNPSSLLRFHK